MDADSTSRQTLLDLEQHLLKPEVRRSPEEVARLLADEFVEIGSSGRRYDRAAIIAALASEEPVQIGISEFRAEQLAPDLALVTYRAVMVDRKEGERHSLRSSIWKDVGGSWQMVFHQGTAIEGS